MHYNFETKAALGPSLGFWEIREGSLFTSILSPRWERLLLGPWGRGIRWCWLVMDGVVNIDGTCFAMKGLSDRVGNPAVSENTATCLEGT